MIREIAMQQFQSHVQGAVTTILYKIGIELPNFLKIDKSGINVGALNDDVKANGWEVTLISQENHPSAIVFSQSGIPKYSIHYVLNNSPFPDVMIHQGPYDDYIIEALKGLKPNVDETV